MTKAQAIFYCREKSEYEGWITHTMLLELWEDDDEIPDYLLELLCYPPEKEYKPYTMIMGRGLKEQLDMATCHFMLEKEISEHPNS